MPSSPPSASPPRPSPRFDAAVAGTQHALRITHAVITIGERSTPQSCVWAVSSERGISAAAVTMGGQQRPQPLRHRAAVCPGATHPILTAGRSQNSEIAAKISEGSAKKFLLTLVLSLLISDGHCSRVRPAPLQRLVHQPPPHSGPVSPMVWEESGLSPSVRACVCLSHAQPLITDHTAVIAGGHIPGDESLEDV